MKNEKYDQINEKLNKIQRKSIINKDFFFIQKENYDLTKYNFQCNIIRKLGAYEIS